jgi:polygalacturonase
MRNIKTATVIMTAILLSFTFNLQAQDYKASLFGIESNGTTLNTTSIQAAIDYIHDKGGGRLMFYVGRYLTGTIHLKSNVTLHLEEGAILVGSTNPFDYEKMGGWQALIYAIDQENVAITGKGVIDGQGYRVANNILSMVHKGVIKDPQNLIYDRPRESIRPQNIYFKGCKNVTIQGIILKDPGCWNQQYDQCKNLLIDGITVDSKSYWNNDGVDIVDCDSVIVKNSYFDAADDGICLKSHSADFVCRNVYIYNNKVRTSANGIKFGTASRGGFKNIKIINNLVYNTYRSAITFAAVDGGFVEDIIVDSLRSINTGNVIFLRIGERIAGKKGRMNNISISNVYATVPATKADAGYSYEGPVEDLPRNISPSSIVGAKDVNITNVTLKNVEIHYPGGSDANYAKLGLDELEKVPEMSASYPEFSMFKELPAWGFYIRHADHITFDNVSLIADKEDFRTAIVLDDVHDSAFKTLKVTEPGKKKEPVYSYKSTKVDVEK